MSFDNLPVDVRTQIRTGLARMAESKKLEITGSTTVQVELSVFLSFDIEFEHVELTEGSRFETVLAKAMVERPAGSENYSEPETVLTFHASPRAKITEDEIQDFLEEHLADEIRKKAENGVVSTSGLSIDYTELQDVDLQDIFIENQDEVDQWNDAEVVW